MMEDDKIFRMCVCACALFFFFVFAIFVPMDNGNKLCANINIIIIWYLRSIPSTGTKYYNWLVIATVQQTNNKTIKPGGSRTKQQRHK